MSTSPDPVQLTYQELEQESAKMVCALATYNTQIGREMIASLQDRLPSTEMAGVLLVSLERLLWMDSAAFTWAIDHLIPADVMREIHRITTAHIGKQLVDRGFTPGCDFSLNAAGHLMLSDAARAAMTNCASQRHSERRSGHQL